MTKTSQAHQPSSKAQTVAKSQTTVVSEEKPFDPTRSKDEAQVYSEASELNREHDFVHAILKAREPVHKPEYVPPAPPPAVVTQTQLEMEAGRKRVMEFAAQEIERQEAHERHKNDKWAQKPDTAVFRPDDYVPDQKKGQGNVGGTSTPV